MLLEQSKKRKMAIPRLTGEALERVERNLARGMPYAVAAKSFVSTFLVYEIEEMDISEEEVIKILIRRFKKMCSDKRHGSYKRIQEKKLEYQEICDVFGVGPLFDQAIELQRMFQEPWLSVNQKLKILDQARKLEIKIKTVSNIS